MNRRADPLLRALEVGLVLVLALAPLPFGAVRPGGRLALEVVSGVLMLLWTARALARGTALPSRGALAGLVGLLIWGAIQIAPSGPIAGIVSPRAAAIRAASSPADAPIPVVSATLSLDPGATASALRTGAAFVALFLVACTVAAERGARAIAASLACGAAFQGLHGTIVLASGAATIWGEAKTAYVDCATGTFINRNHFAALLAASIPAGAALAMSIARREPAMLAGRRGILLWLGTRGSQSALVAILVVSGAIGLLLSFSRTGSALGIAAVGLTVLAARIGGIRARAAAFALLFGIALLPLAQIGADRFVERWSETGEAIADEGGRLAVAGDTLRLAAAFPVSGSGFGTFADAYPLFRSPEVRLHYTHAHQDLLQLLAEGGLVAGALLGLVLVPTGRRLVEAIGGAYGTTAIGIAAGLAAILLHALVDFVFHIPATAAIASVLAGALHGLPWHDRR